MKSRTSPLARLLTLAMLTLAGCGVSELYVGFLQVDGGSGAADGGTSSTSSSTGGAGGAMSCTPGTTQACYSGPPGTQGQGICKAGTQTCAADGASWGPCVGEVLPQFLDNCATPEDEDCDGKAPACKGNLLWAKRFGDASDQRATGVAVDPSGNVLVTGYFSGTIDFGGGPLASAGSNDVFVAKLEGATGAHVWSRQFGDASGQSGQAIAVDGSGNVLVAGKFSGAIDFGGGSLVGTANAFVAKLDAAGQHVWSKQIGASGGSVGATAINVDPSGNVLVTGYFSGTTDFGGGPLTSDGPQDVFVTKLDAAGGHVWSKHFGSPDDQMPLAVSVATDLAANVLITGYFSGTIDFGGGPFTTANVSDAFLAKLDAAGGHVWSKQFSGAGATSDGRCVGAGPTGEVLVTGGFSGNVDFGGGSLSGSGLGDAYLVDLNGTGAHAWSKHFGVGSATDSAVGVGVAIDASGNVALTGSFSGAVNFGDAPLAAMSGQDVFLAKLDAAGAHVWSKRFGEASTQTAVGVAVDGVGNVLIVGDFLKVIDFGNGPLTSMGGTDIFLAAFGP